MEKIVVNQSRLLLNNSGIDKIGSKGCQQLCQGDWPTINGVGFCIYHNNQVCCGIREIGCQSMTKLCINIEEINCKKWNNLVRANQIGVLGYRFLKEVAKKVYCNDLYMIEEMQEVEIEIVL